MLREIITSADSNITLRIPNEMIGKTVEVLAFEINDLTSTLTKEQRLNRIEALTNDTLTDLSGFKFNRNEANNYEG